MGRNAFLLGFAATQFRWVLQRLVQRTVLAICVNNNYRGEVLIRHLKVVLGCNDRGVSDPSEHDVCGKAIGEARHHPSKDVDGDGDYDATDYSTIQTISISLNNKIGQADYRSEADLDRDGDVDTTDVTLAGTNYVAALAKGDLSDPAVDNIVGWSGYLFDREIGLYCVRFRYFDVELMRWVNRDPAGHVDSMNLYGYGCKGINGDLTEVCEQLKASYLASAKDGRPSLESAEQVCEVILRISPESDGEVSHLIFQNLEKRCGVSLEQKDPLSAEKARNKGIPAPCGHYPEEG